MNTLLAMTVFEQVARHESFSGAAGALRMSSTAVSRHVRLLEDHLGVKLLHRTTRRVSLTPDGSASLDRIRQIIADVSELEAAVGGAGAPRGHLRVTAGVALGHERLHRLMPGFLQANPDVSVELILTDQHVDLVQERIDLAVRIGRMADSGLVVRRLGEVRHRICAAPEWLAQNPPVESGGLAELPRIIDTNQPAQWILRGPGGDVLQLPASGRYAVNSAHAARDACRAGLGLAMLPDLVACEDLDAGRLADAVPGWEGPRLVVQAAYLERRHLSAAVRALVEWLVAAWAHSIAE
ncbi:MAG: DNA-binding transcriptional LysR family regulator [Myxococcota bacterium]|jgi:DNA-binding transcriptional LysR family regulator